MSRRAIRADALYHEVHVREHKPFRERRHSQRHFLQAVGVVTLCAVEMRMEMTRMVSVTVGTAHVVFQRSAAVIYRVQKMVFLEQCQRTEDCRFVQRRQLHLYVRHAERAPEVAYRAQDHQTVSRRLYSVMLQYLLGRLFHCFFLLVILLLACRQSVLHQRADCHRTDSAWHRSDI